MDAAFGCDTSTLVTVWGNSMFLHLNWQKDIPGCRIIGSHPSCPLVSQFIWKHILSPGDTSLILICGLKVTPASAGLEDANQVDSPLTISTIEMLKGNKARAQLRGTTSRFFSDGEGLVKLVMLLGMGSEGQERRQRGTAESKTEIRHQLSR